MSHITREDNLEPIMHTAADGTMTVVTDDLAAIRQRAADVPRWTTRTEGTDSSAAIDDRVRLLEMLDATAVALPLAADGCACIPHTDGYHYGSTPEPGDALEYNPACPIHSEHLWSPRTGRWVFTDPERQACWEAGLSWRPRQSEAS